jgi:hypothetical protein
VAAQGNNVFFLLLIFVDHFDGQTTARRKPQTLRPGCLSTPRSKTLTTVTGNSWLVVVFSHLMAVNNSDGSATVAIFILRLHNTTPQTTVTHPSHTSPPPADTIIWLVVVLLHQMVANQGQGSAHLSLFRSVSFWHRPGKGASTSEHEPCHRAPAMHS